ncbi:DUF721 domain-containing protein [Streptomyces sp. bgisy100]|uniref:DUF721 domain-containing protein n=1 Tax=Streptomyces sp. bgisy100 TaxID=3413783 RepID=UPI003D762C9C
MAFDADTGRLDLAPDAPAYGTKLRWSAPQLITAVNSKVTDTTVRTLHVLPPAPGQARPAAAAPDLQPATPVASAERRTPPDGYHRAIEAHRQAAPPSRVDPGIKQAVERQTRAMRELSQRAFPDSELHSDSQPAPIDQARAQRRRQAATTEAAALRRARTERAAREASTAAAVPQPAALRTTA